MTLDKQQIDHIYYLTRTGLQVKQIERIAADSDSFFKIIDTINDFKRDDKERDWVVFDLEYEDDKLVSASNTEIIAEENIKDDTYIHKCRDKNEYLQKIVGSSSICRLCDTQFFPELWWNHPERDKYTYAEIKHNINFEKYLCFLDENYIRRLVDIGVDERVLLKAVAACHSPFEVEKMLKTQFYDWRNPPPTARIHRKLMTLAKIWKILPVRMLGIYPDGQHFFHKCHNDQEKILFDQKNIYAWCDTCFTKFIPESDYGTIELYKDMVHVLGYRK